jgi:hypothetical protein
MSLKKKLIDIFGSQIEFNKDFDLYSDNLKEGMKLDLIKWCEDCFKGEALGSVPPKKEHKDLFVFFRKIGNSTRAILIKRQNNKFIELNLTNHLNYDNKRKDLGYKKSSYYKS